jgi:hypothetical protein
MSEAVIFGTSVTLVTAAGAGSTVTALSSTSNQFRCGNRSVANWARIFISSDPGVIGVAGGAPLASLNLLTNGTQIPPGQFVDIAVGANTNYYATAWLENGVASTVVVESLSG